MYATDTTYILHVFDYILMSVGLKSCFFRESELVRFSAKNQYMYSNLPNNHVGPDFSEINKRVGLNK